MNRLIFSFMQLSSFDLGLLAASCAFFFFKYLDRFRSVILRASGLELASVSKHDTRRKMVMKIVKMEVLTTCIRGGLKNFSTFYQALPIAQYVCKICMWG